MEVSFRSSVHLPIARVAPASMGRRAFTLLAAIGLPSLGLALGGRALAAETVPYRVRKLRSADDEPTSLAHQARDRHLVVVVMKGHWCQVCIAQLQRLSALQTKLSRLGARVVGLNADSVKANRRVMEQMNLAYPILSDRERAVIRGLGLWSAEHEMPFPALLVFDRCGREQARRLGRAPSERPEPELLRLLRDLQQKTKTCDGANS